MSKLSAFFKNTSNSSDCDRYVYEQMFPFELESEFVYFTLDAREQAQKANKKKNDFHKEYSISHIHVPKQI